MTSKKDQETYALPIELPGPLSNARLFQISFQSRSGTTHANVISQKRDIRFFTFSTKLLMATKLMPTMAAAHQQVVVKPRREE